jgi:hypothetical protein
VSSSSKPQQPATAAGRLEAPPCVCRTVCSSRQGVVNWCSNASTCCSMRVLGFVSGVARRPAASIGSCNGVNL